MRARLRIRAMVARADDIPYQPVKLPQPDVQVVPTREPLVLHIACPLSPTSDR
jgi:hypothetical protein